MDISYSKVSLNIFFFKGYFPILLPNIISFTLFIVRSLCVIKGYVHNKVRPEGSIAKGYVAEECVTFCARYLVHMDSRLNQVGRYMERASDDLQWFVSV